MGRGNLEQKLPKSLQQLCSDDIAQPELAKLGIILKNVLLQTVVYHAQIR